MTALKMIANYFKLQAKILKRHVEDAGFPAFALFPAIALLYILSYYGLKQYPTWGAYLLILANFQYLFVLSDFKRNDFLKTVFFRIRVLQNQDTGKFPCEFGLALPLASTTKLPLSFCALKLLLLLYFYVHDIHLETKYSHSFH